MEALRLVAAAGIAVFHTFMPWFDLMTSADGLGAVLAGRPAAATLLGFIDLLGAYGNNVFFLISGLFLVPEAARASRDAGYWALQGKKTVRRAGSILAAVVLYCAVALLVSTLVLPLDGVSLHETEWFTGSLEFIWVYLALTVLAPVIGWAWERMRQPRAVTACFTAAVFVGNGYIAFFSQVGDGAGLLDWRKLMSAVTYLTAYLAGAALADVRLDRRRAGALLGAVVASAVAIEGSLAVAGELELMWDTSYKSTSLISFALAAASLVFARSTGGKGQEAHDDATGRLAVAVAPSILGFYILQSLFSPLWWPAFTQLTGDVLESCGTGAFLAAGVALSLSLLTGALAVDRLARIPLFRRLGLA